MDYRNYDEAIEILKTKPDLISEISFDHDLGVEHEGYPTKTGYDVLCWIEKRVALGEWTFVPKMTIHSANPVGRKRMEWAITSIHRFVGKEV